MTNNTMNNAANNQTAAQEATRILNGKNFKESVAKLAKYGSNVFKNIVSGIQDMSNMDNEQVRATVHETFETAKAKLLTDLEVINSIPAYRNSYVAKDLETALKNFIAVEKEILSNKDCNIVGKILIMFWTACKAIAGMIVKSCIKAAKFIGIYGIRIIAVGMDFIIKIVKKAVKLFKEVWTVAKAVKVTKDGNEQEIEEDYSEDACI